MKKALLITAAIAMCIGMVSASNPMLTDNLQEYLDAKNAAITHSTMTPGLPVGGEDVGSAAIIPGLPFMDTGDTGLYFDDYDEACIFTGSTSPDVVYSYTPTADVSVDIDLCGAGTAYDTKVYVYENVVTAGSPYACNDDFCDNGVTFYLSRLECVDMTVGNTYYIVVDGYGGASGAYELNIAECVPPPAAPNCVLPCPPGSMAEGEADCFTNYDDTYNGGCNSNPSVFTDIPCDADPKVICGTTGNFLYNTLSYRDMDWYSINWPGGTLTAQVCSSTPMGVWILSGTCAFLTTEGFDNTNDPLTGSFTYANLPAGQYIVIASIDNWYGMPCGLDYVLTVGGCPSSATESGSWGDVKSLFR